MKSIIVIISQKWAGGKLTIIPHTQQKELTQEEFEKNVSYIETIFDDKTASRFNGMSILFLTNGVFDQPYFVNTMFQDICDIMHRNSFWWLDTSFGIDNPQLHGLKKANKKEFRGRLKGTPTQTISYTRIIFAKENPFDKNYKFLSSFFPVRQKETYIKTECKKAFSGDPAAQPYDSIMGNAIEFLDCNKTLSKTQWENLPPMLSTTNGRFETSNCIQKGICRLFEASMSWGIVYDWKGIEFIFPMEREYILNVLKNREKINGRRPLLPRTVKEHQRNGKTISRHFSAASIYDETPYILNGRNYSVLIGPESYDAYLPGSKKLISEIKDYYKENQ